MIHTDRIFLPLVESPEFSPIAVDSRNMAKRKERKKTPLLDIAFSLRFPERPKPEIIGALHPERKYSRFIRKNFNKPPAKPCRFIFNRTIGITPAFKFLVKRENAETSALDCFLIIKKRPRQAHAQTVLFNAVDPLRFCFGD